MEDIKFSATKFQDCVKTIILDSERSLHYLNLLEMEDLKTAICHYFTDFFYMLFEILKEGKNDELMENIKKISGHHTPICVLGTVYMSCCDIIRRIDRTFINTENFTSAKSYLASFEKKIEELIAEYPSVYEKISCKIMDDVSECQYNKLELSEMKEFPFFSGV